MQCYSLKILSFFPIFRVSNQGFTYSGGERRFIEIGRVWSALGNDVHVVTTSYGRRLMREFDFEASTYAYDPFSFRRLGFCDFVDVKRMLRVIPDEKFDLIYAPGETFSCVVVSGIAGRRLKIPVAVSFNLLGSVEIRALDHFRKSFMNYVYGGDVYAFLKAFPRSALLAFKSYVRNFFARNFDLLFSVGSEVKRLLVKMGIHSERIFIVGAGVDLRRVSKVTGADKVYDACFMGQIIPRKGVADLVEAWRMVVQEKPDAKLIVLGRGPKQYETVIRDLIKKYDLEDNVSMPGFVSEDEKYRVLKGSRIFVFPSYLEAFGQVICEAMACELPVVAYDLPFYGDWYGDVICSVVTGDVEGLSREIIRLLGDEDLRASLGCEGRRVSEQYSWENVAKYQIEIINRRVMLYGL